MTKKNISIDVNDVLRDYTRQFMKIYNKVINPDFKINYDDVNEWDFSTLFPFDDKREYFDFLYDSTAYEIFGCAETMDRSLGARFSTWVERDMRNFDEENTPNLRIVSPFETHLAIPSTMHFLSRIGCKVREYYFPIVSSTIWDNTDILITANPKLIESKPEGKVVIKINTPYNQNVDADYTFQTFMEMMDSRIIEKLIEE